MQIDMINPGDIRFNPAEGLFEARMQVITPTGVRSYACSVAGDLSMPLEKAALGLRAHAQACHEGAPHLGSVTGAPLPAPLRATPRTDWRAAVLRGLPFVRALRAA